MVPRGDGRPDALPPLIGGGGWVVGLVAGWVVVGLSVGGRQDASLVGWFLSRSEKLNGEGVGGVCWCPVPLPVWVT